MCVVCVAGEVDSVRAEYGTRDTHGEAFTLLHERTFTSPGPWPLSAKKLSRLRERRRRQTTGRRCGVVASEDEGGEGVWTEAWSHCRRSRRLQGGTRRRLRTPERGSTGVTAPGSAAEGSGRLAD